MVSSTVVGGSFPTSVIGWGLGLEEREKKSEGDEMTKQEEKSKMGSQTSCSCSTDLVSFETPFLSTLGTSLAARARLRDHVGILETTFPSSIFFFFHHFLFFLHLLDTVSLALAFDINRKSSKMNVELLGKIPFLSSDPEGDQEKGKKRKKGKKKKVTVGFSSSSSHSRSFPASVSRGQNLPPLVSLYVFTLLLLLLNILLL